MAIPKDYSRVIFALIAGMIFAIWIYINYNPEAATLFLIMMASSIIVYYISAGLGAKTPMEGVGSVIGSVLYGIDKNWKVDAFYGLISGALFIIFMNASSLVMGYPLALFELVTFSAKMIVNGIIAPIGEEAMFVLILWLAMKFTKSISVAAVITSFAFAIFHYSAYGEGIPTAYVAAFLFRMGMIGLILYTKSILPAIVAHSMINTYLYFEEQAAIV